MGHMKWRDIEPYEPEFWSKNRIELLRKRMISFDHQRSVVSFDDGSSVKYSK
jgi:hypothetical protein